jgi:hypothetical protein
LQFFQHRLKVLQNSKLLQKVRVKNSVCQTVTVWRARDNRADGETSRKIVNSEISLSELEQYLWGAANILRGPVDKADFKLYIFPLLFFKRISDVYDKEYGAALKESEGDEEYATFPEQHKFSIPEGAHWNDVREKTENVGQHLHLSRVQLTLKTGD